MLEKPVLRLGYMPLTDCLPLVAASRWGLFADEGLEVTLQRETSWATLRDRVMVGQLDAAQMLAPMVLAGTLGLGGLKVPLLTAHALGRNGNAITVSTSVFETVRAHADDDSAAGCAAALARLVTSRARQGQPRLVFAVVFAFSSHAYLLRHWLALGGLDPDRDLELVVLPPSQMADHLRLGQIDGFCVGEPWNSHALQTGAGRVLLSGHQIRTDAPEKVLGVTADWAQRHPGSHAALVRALHRAGQRIVEDLPRALALLTDDDHVPVSPACVAMAPSGQLAGGLAQQLLPAGHFHQFSGAQANLPLPDDACWFLAQMRRWQQLPGDAGSDDVVVAACWRDDWHRAFLSSCGNGGH